MSKLFYSHQGGSLTFWGASALVILSAGFASADGLMSGKLRPSRIENKLAAGRLQLKAEADEPEVVVEGVRKRKVAATDQNARKRLRASLRSRKTKRVVAAQN